MIMNYIGIELDYTFVCVVSMSNDAYEVIRNHKKASFNLLNLKNRYEGLRGW